MQDSDFSRQVWKWLQSKGFKLLRNKDLTSCAFKIPINLDLRLLSKKAQIIYFLFLTVFNKLDLMIIADDRIGLLDRGKSSDRSMKKITGKVRVENENNNTLKTKGYNKRA